MSLDLYPLLLDPLYKKYLWGGNKIATFFGRAIEGGCAESWELTCRNEGCSVIRNGKYAGLDLQALLEAQPAFFGSAATSRLPLLIKIIDAKEPLSIQVHPSKYDRSNPLQEPKSEMWHIIDADPSSKIYLGLKENLSEDAIARLIQENTLDKYMNVIYPQKGETYYIPSGTLHAIGAGCLIYEVQQNSNTTYRLYDWGRVDTKGQSRTLHIHEGLKAMLENQINLHQQPSKEHSIENGNLRVEELSCPYFNFSKLNLRNGHLLLPHAHFRVFFVLQGDLNLIYKNEKIELNYGQTFLVPANCPNCYLEPKSAQVTLFETIPI